MRLGNNLKAQINLLQLGIKEEVNVTLNYLIKDFSGKTYLTESETITVYRQKSLSKEFYTKDIPSGNYVLGVELIYPDGVAVASSQFKIKEKLKIGKKELILISLIFVLIFIAIAIYLATKRYKRKMEYLKG